jgi:hypothetical protein
MRGYIVDVRPKVREERLRVVARIRTEDWGTVDAYLPDRELAAVLPRAVLLGEKRTVPRKYIKTLSPIIKRVAGGREVQVWRFEDNHYFRFLSWRGIRFQT